MSRLPRVLQVSATCPEPAVIAEAVRVLEAGGLVAFPTETVYGLGARGLHAADVQRIFAAKERPVGHPLILHVDGEDMARALASSWPDRASVLARAFWPGPLTLVVPRAPSVPDAVTGGLGTVGVRAPRHAVALALLRAAGEPLAAPSANAHTHVSPTTAAHVVRSLGKRVDLVLDAGPCAHGIESTVIDLASDPPRVLRAGAASLEAIRAVLPEVAYEAITVANEMPRASPGLASKHYAPRTRVVLTASGASIADVAREAANAGVRVGAILWSDAAQMSLEVATRAGLALAVRAHLPADAEAYGRTLFAALHDADEAGLDLLVIERVPDTLPWWAVADRLRRASQS